MWIFIILFSLLIDIVGQDFNYKHEKTLEITKPTDEIVSVFIDDLSNIYLTDAGLRQVLLLNSEGSLINQIPSDEKSKILDEPVSTIVLSDGRIVVLDRGNSKVVYFDKEGKKLKEFGNTENFLSSFDEPVKMLKDKLDNIYILDTGNKKIIKFNSEGLFLRAFSVKDPIAFSVDFAQNLYVLSRKGDVFEVQIADENFRLIKSFSISVLGKPIDLLANDFGEIYVLDAEKGSAMYFGKDGIYHGTKVGTNMSSKGIAQFSDLKCGYLVNIDNKSEKLFLYDNDFKYLQSFIIEYGAVKEKRTLQELVFNVKYLDELKNFSFQDMFISNDTTYFILPDYSVAAKTGDSQLFKLSNKDGKTSEKKYSMSEPKGVAKHGESLFLVDQDENKIHIFNSKNGQHIASQSSRGEKEGQLNNAKDILAASDGKIFIADYGNNRINIYSSQGISIGTIQSPVEGILTRPVKIALDNKKNLFILSEEKEIFVYNLNTKELRPLSLSGIRKATELAVLDDDILLIYDDQLGSIYLFKENTLFSQFFSKGTSYSELKNVSSLYYDYESGKLYVSDTKQNITKIYKLMFKPPIPVGLEFVINDNGNSEIKWEKNSNKILSYRIWKKNFNDETKQLVANQKEQNYIIKEPQKEILQYAVESISEDGIASGVSDFVTDEFSYYLYLSETKPDTSINLLKKLRPKNEKVIDERIAIAYRRLANRFKQEHDYEKYFMQMSELQKMKPKNLDLYFEKVKIYEDLNKFQEAIEELTKAYAVYPNNKEIYYNLVRLYFNTKNYTKIVELYNSVTVTIKEEEKSLESLARAYKLLGQNVEASEIYKRLANSTNSEKYYSKAGRILYELNNIEDAMIYLQRAASLNSTDAETYSTLAECYALKSDWSNASLTLENALALDSTNAANFYTLGKIYSKQKNTLKAIENFKKACQFDSIKTDYILDLIDELEKANLRKDASIYLDKLTKTDSDNPLVLLRAAKYQFDENKVDEAFATISKALKLAPNDKSIKESFSEISRVREKKNKKEPTIKITDIYLDNIFPSLFYYYRTNPIGYIKIYNSRNFPLDNVQIKVSSPQLFVEDFIAKIPVVLPGAEKEIRIISPLKNEVISNSINSYVDYELNFELSFSPDSTDAQQLKYKDVKRNEIKMVRVESLNSIRWDDKKHLGSFINSRDENVRNFVVTQIINKYKDLQVSYPDIPKNILNAMIIWEYLRYYGLAYMSDPNFAYENISQTSNIDYVQFAQQTLLIRTGDCDDLVTLLATFLESIGINTAYVDIPGHVFLIFDTGINESDIKSKGLTEDKVRILWNKAWITLEATVIGKNTFVESWTNSNHRYSQTIAENKPVVPVQFKQAWEIYPPIQYPESKKIDSSLTDPSIIKNAIIADINYYYNMTKGNIEFELLSSLNKHPDNVFLINKLAMYYISIDSLKKAKLYYEKSLKLDNANQVTLINLGNLYFKDGNYTTAEEYWLKANAISNETNYGVLVNLAKVKLAQGDKQKARQFFDKAMLINKDVSVKFSNIYKSIY